MESGANGVPAPVHRRGSRSVRRPVSTGARPGHTTAKMYLCFVVEEQYRRDSMPMVIADQLQQWGHTIDLLEPPDTVTCLSDLAIQSYDAYVLKTVSGGPGFSILEAAEAVGIPTINNSRSISLVRDKTIASAFAHARGVPVPRTYFVAHPNLLTKIPEKDYPLVVKPANGSACRGVYRLNSPADLTRLESENLNGFFLAQHYVENPGYDVKLYVIGKDVYAVAKKSPLHPEMAVKEQLLPLAVEWRRLARRVGEIFGLDIYGLDVLETRNGPVVVDINDFPSFGHVPGAVGHVASYILRIAEQARSKRRRNKVMVAQAFAALKPILQDEHLVKGRMSQRPLVNLAPPNLAPPEDSTKKGGAGSGHDTVVSPDTHDAA